MSAVSALQAWNNGSPHIRRLEQQLGSTAKAFEASQEIHEDVVKQMTPSIRSALQQAYFQSGLKTKSGALLKAVSTEARIEAATAFSGIFISISDHAADQVYKRAGAFDYGAHYGGAKGSKAENKKAKKFAASIYARSFGGARYLPPRPGFFDLSSYDFEGIYTRLFKEGMERQLTQRKFK